MNNTIDEDTIAKADSFADQAHSGHTRSNRAMEPYIGHLREVATMVRLSGGTTEEICAGLLHDSVEDTATTLEDIQFNFGKEVMDIVESLTDDPAHTALDTLTRKTIQAEHVRLASSQVKRVKLADQISNICCVTIDPPEKWSVNKCEDYIRGAKLIANECCGVSEYLDTLFDEAYKAASLVYTL